MTDFIDAFKGGLDAAKAADRARKEIDEVFSDLDRQIIEVSEGKLSIERREYYVTKSSWEALRFSFPPKSKETYWAIVAKNPTIKKTPYKELAKWQEDPVGYPCKLIWAKQEQICEDRAALEICLADLLRDPIVGERLYVLMNLEPLEDGAERAERDAGPESPIPSDSNGDADCGGSVSSDVE